MNDAVNEYMKYHPNADADTVKSEMEEAAKTYNGLTNGLSAASLAQERS